MALATLAGCASGSRGRDVKSVEALQMSARQSSERGDLQAAADHQFNAALLQDALAAQTTDAVERQRLLQGAVDSYTEVLRLVPNDPAAYGNRADTEKALARRDDALRDLDAAILYGEGADRAFYLRRRGDMNMNRDPRDYFTALEWNPYDFIARRRVLDHLAAKPNDIQIANYLRFLLEHHESEAAVDASAALVGVTSNVDTAAATALALARAAVVVPPEEVERIAAPFVKRAPEAGHELLAAIRGDDDAFGWIKANAGESKTTSLPPHAAFRALAHAVGSEAAARGDLARAERQHRLATRMPGADLEDLRQLMQFLADFLPKKLPDAMAAAEPDAKPPVGFHSMAAFIYALIPVCGNDDYGVRHHVLRLNLIGAAAPPIAREVCPGLPPVPDDCCSKLGVSARARPGLLLVIPNGISDQERRCALEMLALDYRTAIFAPLVIESPASRADSAEEARSYLASQGVPVKIVTAQTRGAALRIRLEH